MKRWEVEVKRMQVWRVEVDADDVDVAKTAGEAAIGMLPDDDYGYDTTAKEIK